jgi:hypothetical protein
MIGSSCCISEDRVEINVNTVKKTLEDLYFSEKRIIFAIKIIVILVL